MFVRPNTSIWHFQLYTSNVAVPYMEAYWSWTVTTTTQFHFKWWTNKERRLRVVKWYFNNSLTIMIQGLRKEWGLKYIFSIIIYIVLTCKWYPDPDYGGINQIKFNDEYEWFGSCDTSTIISISLLFVGEKVKYDAFGISWFYYCTSKYGNYKEKNSLLRCLLINTSCILQSICDSFTQDGTKTNVKGKFSP